MANGSSLVFVAGAGSSIGEGQAVIAEGNLTLNTSGLSNGNVYKWNLVSSEAVTSSNTLTINGNGTPTLAVTLIIPGILLLVPLPG